ncbi:MAG: YebC/PmpR family DNA-binding transcriptional regulator, partial [Wolbachia sp.]
PKDLIEISDKELIDKLSALVEELEDNDDVQYVEGNFTFVDKL